MSHAIVILTGAGISAESGLQTFRAADGLWENHRIEDVATPEGFAKDPLKVQAFYNTRRQQLLSDEVSANPAHYALAKLEREFPGEVLIVTQNIDDLHERAGSQNVLHMHGELLQMRCVESGQVFPVHDDITAEQRCACCQKAGTLRPNIVWFGEMPLGMSKIEQAIQRCDHFVAIGTSGHVYPAAGFVAEANSSGAHSLEINLEPSLVNSAFQQTLIGKASVRVPEWVEQQLSGLK
ncbi:NAD-dependent deacetylase [Sinobacterium caligoides]|uniref:NAD-dependent protein deacylase n=1 Tax=Sinobacterium caligoides TaxID=933926 RepID=A0A3N2DE72_9GAMM|nr:Sir2 family NAD+-dependent deacetylase [Sinobacterium caligoides]ROR97958.1 NAD-dependent deacetylase [Sinobacterium caligoides]